MKEELKKIRFNITEEMSNTLLKMIVIHQMMESSDSISDNYMLENYYRYLNNYFISELHKNNKEQIALYNQIIDD